MSSFVDSVIKKRIDGNRVRWHHVKAEFFRDIRMKQCIYCKKEKPCFDPKMGNFSEKLTFCKDCIDQMFDLSVETKKERIARLQEEKNEQEKMLAKYEEDKAKEKAGRKLYKEKRKIESEARKEELKTKRNAIDEELTLLMKKEE
jgi:hypothetical protein